MRGFNILWSIVMLLLLAFTPQPLLAQSYAPASVTATMPLVAIEKGRSVRVPANQVFNAIAEAGIPRDVTVLPDSTGGNAGAKNEVIGLPRIKLIGLGLGTDGSAAGKTLALMDDTPSGEWTAIDASTTVSTDATYYKVGTKSLKTIFATTATAGDGVHAVPSTYDFSSDESIGFWAYVTKALAAGDLLFNITDSVAGVSSVAVPALTANTWQWVELDISGIADASMDVVNDLSFTLSTAGATKAAAGAFSLYLDGAYKWDATEEKALGVAIQQDGVLGVTRLVVTGAVTGLDGASAVEGTDFFVAYRTGSDSLVIITDQSASVLTTLVAY